MNYEEAQRLLPKNGDREVKCQINDNNRFELKDYEEILKKFDFWASPNDGDEPLKKSDFNGKNSKKLLGILNQGLSYLSELEKSQTHLERINSRSLYLNKAGDLKILPHSKMVLNPENTITMFDENTHQQKGLEVSLNKVKLGNSLFYYILFLDYIGSS